MLKASSDRTLQGVTLWRRIADDVEREIIAGVYAVGERLPGEVEIARRFDVNRHTVRSPSLASVAWCGRNVAAAPSSNPAELPIRSGGERDSPKSSAAPDARST